MEQKEDRGGGGGGGDATLASYNADVKYDDRRREDIGGVFSESNKRDDSGAQRWCDVSTTTTGDTANRNDSDVTT